MKGLRRNFTPFYYATMAGVEETTIPGSELAHTGEYTIQYNPIELLKANISPARGSTVDEPFGVNANYSKSIYVDDFGCAIDEHTVLWLGFGIVEDFDSSVTYHNGDLVLHGGKMWCFRQLIQASPSVEEDGWNPLLWLEVPYNYIVVGVARSLPSGGVVYAVSEVDVSRTQLLTPMR